MSSARPCVCYECVAVVPELYSVGGRYVASLHGVSCVTKRHSGVRYIRDVKRSRKPKQGVAELLTAAGICVATHSTVPFPQEAYLRRIDRLAADCQARVCAALPPNCSPAEAAAAIQEFLQHGQQFKVAPCGRSNLPKDSIVDHRMSFLLPAYACVCYKPRGAAFRANPGKNKYIESKS